MVRAMERTPLRSQSAELALQARPNERAGFGLHRGVKVPAQINTNGPGIENMQMDSKVESSSLQTDTHRHS